MAQRILILGGDGYLGWPTAMAFSRAGHRVAIVDNFAKRHWELEVGVRPLLPIPTLHERVRAWREVTGLEIELHVGDLTDYAFVESVFAVFRPEAVVHYGEQPSAPYSMIDQKHAAFTQQNNVIGSLNLLWAIKEACPNAHLVKLGTMGEYGTPNIAIPEGFIEIEYRGRKDTLPFPRQAGSFYHWSKVHDSGNTMFACRIWGLRSTDIMQGVVFGTQIDVMGDDPRLRSRLDFDQCFGTAINRFCCQAAIGHPLTLYGLGGQTRGFLPMRDSIQCMTLAIENPPEAGEYRVFNQFEETYSIEELAAKVQQAGVEIGLDIEIHHYDNPRKELEKHFFEADRQHLMDLGYQPTHDVVAEVKIMLRDLLPHRERILEKAESLVPDIRWDGSRRRSVIIDGEKSVV